MRYGFKLGVTRAELDKAIQNGFDLSQIDGFHFHTLCEQNSDALETTLDAVEKKLEICCTDGNGLIGWRTSYHKSRLRHGKTGGLHPAHAGNI